MRVSRRRAMRARCSPLSGFLMLWLSFAFLVNKAPNYTRLLVTLPFVAYLVTRRRSLAGGRWRSVPAAPALLSAGPSSASSSWNLAIAWDFIETGRREGEHDRIERDGTSQSHDDIAGKKFFLATSEDGGLGLLSDGSVRHSLAGSRLFALGRGRVGATVDPEQVERFVAEPPFALLMRRDLWQQNAARARQSISVRTDPEHHSRREPRGPRSAGCLGAGAGQALGEVLSLANCSQACALAAGSACWVPGSFPFRRSRGPERGLDDLAEGLALGILRVVVHHVADRAVDALLLAAAGHAAEVLHLRRVADGCARDVAAVRLEAVRRPSPRSLCRHQSAVLTQSPPTYGRMCEVTSR